MALTYSWRETYLYRAMIPGPTDGTEPKKAVISNTLWDTLAWHKWAVISISGSIVLIYLNLAEIAIGGEIGGTPASTANILGALQLAVKAHELTIIASLLMIARQWIQGSLINLNKGLPLGLVGAEKELSRPSFIFSKGYLTAVGFASSVWRTQQTPQDLSRKRELCLLTIFLFTATLLSSLAGPASAVLMIPRVHWFFDSESELTMNDTMTGYPYILVRPVFEYGNTGVVQEPFDPQMLFWTRSDLQYWEDLTNINTRLDVVPEKETIHNYASGGQAVRVNITTPPGRSMDRGNNGSTHASTVMKDDGWLGLEYWGRRGHEDPERDSISKSRWSGGKYVMDAHVMIVEVNCSYRPQGLITQPNSPDLLFLFQGFTASGSEWKKVYITEGPRLQNNPEFTNSLEVVFHQGSVPSVDGVDSTFNETYLNSTIPTFKVTVCSISTSITPSEIYSLVARYSSEYADYSSLEHKTLLFHERWFDGTNWLRDEFDTERPERFSTGNLTLPPRNMSELTDNPHLRRFGEVVASPVGGLAGRAISDPSTLETVVSGAFVSVYSYMWHSSTQYIWPSASESKNLSMLALPKSLMPEPENIFPVIKRTIRKYNLGYGFRLSSRTGILGIIVLLAHAAIVVLGSLWQLLWQRSVIAAWETIPEYVALGLGSTIPAEVLDNTCAGISSGKTLQNIVRVGETTDQHLEIIVGEEMPGARLATVLGRVSGTYGSRGGSRKEKLE